MKIAILDGYTINPGDLSWEPIEALGECEIFPRTMPQETFERSKNADIIITSKVVFDRELLLKLPSLKYIGVIATGYNVIDLEAARERNVIVTNIPDYCASSVAQMVFAHVLELARRVGHHDNSVKKGEWSSNEDFCYWEYPQMELNGKILGLIGCGNIGSNVANTAISFGMQVLAYDPYPRHMDDDPPIEFVDIDTVFTQSDVISLHCPLTAETKEIIRTSTLSKMKPTAFVINTARGPLVNEADLSRALNNGIIGGAGLDVLNIEPPDRANPLFRTKNCFITPHIAWASQESRVRLIKMTADNIEAFLAGRPTNVVN